MPRWKKSLVVTTVVLLFVFGLTMLDTFFRQLVFGPKYNGIPLISWQKFFRQWDVADPKMHRESPSLFDNVHEALVSTPDPVQWKLLSGEDRRAILLSLAENPQQEIIRMHIAGHLGDVPGSPEVLTHLKRYTTDSAARVRQYAAESLGRINPPADECAPELAKLLGDDDPNVRQNAARAISRLGSKAPDIVGSKLLEQLQSREPKIRLQALDALAGMQFAPQEVIPPVVEALEDPDWRIRAEALRALGFIKAKQALPQIIKAMGDPNETVRTSATYAIGNIGPDAKAAIPNLLAQLQTLTARSVVHVDPPALVALGKMGQAAQPAIPELLKLRNHELEIVRQAVEKTLSQIDPIQFPAKTKLKGKIP